jgi:hypothetical protein
MSEFFSLLVAFIPADKRTFWELINSQVLSTIVAAIVAILVAKYGGAAKSNAETNQDVISATNAALKLESENPEPAVVPEIPGARDFRRESVELLQGAKQYLDSVAEADSDGRHKRTYNAIPRYDYVVLAVALKERAQIDRGQVIAASELFSLWNAYDKRNGKKTVPEAAYNLLKTASDKLVRNNKKTQKRS